MAFGLTAQSPFFFFSQIARIECRECEKNEKSCRKVVDNLF